MAKTLARHQPRVKYLYRRHHSCAALVQMWLTTDTSWVITLREDNSTCTSGLLAALSVLHVIMSLLSGRNLNRSGIDSMGESLLNTRPEIYDRFEEVLVTDVLDDVVIGGTTGRLGDSDGEM
ncbi:hypothetical protein PV327_002830 [Microctonus hyperodae]|uniref:Uncharacterized protein n=1 Tax=Microctonus hyperodae TaxID=165561 RepID=A0AA39FGU5_MICHY|nr:hypothetical protein PV327_002830 [Microctonus hyperodae]